ncbi:MAG: hypothetical protein ABIS23_04290 [Sphingomicrobium sp.]
MTTSQILELVIAAILLGAGIWLYRRPSPAPDHYGSQGAVLLFAVAAILVVHVIVTVRALPATDPAGTDTIVVAP